MSIMDKEKVAKVAVDVFIVIFMALFLYLIFLG
jgi:hypothetical protein